MCWYKNFNVIDIIGLKVCLEREKMCQFEAHLNVNKVTTKQQEQSVRSTWKYEQEQFVRSIWKHEKGKMFFSPFALFYSQN